MATLYLAPSWRATLAHVRQRVAEVQRGQPLAPLSLLLPDADAVQAMQGELGNRLGINLATFYRLAETIGAATGAPMRVIGAATQRRLVQRLLAEMEAAGELSDFAPLRAMPGFVEALRDWLREMKTQAIHPQALAQAAANERDQQLARFYARYQQFLHEAQRADPDGQLWLAADSLERQPTLLAGERPLLVLGFDQVNPLQQRILRALAARRPNLECYLLWDSTRPADSLALTRLRATRAALHAALNPTEQWLPDEASDEAPALRHLRRTLFERAEPWPHPADGSVRAVAAPSREGEVRHALRAVKARLLEGVPPSAMALLAPQPARYERLVRAVAAEYDVPVACEQPLALSPAVTTLLTLLSLAPHFPWRESFEALRSPYVRQPWLDGAQVEQLDRLTRERPVIAGRAQWHHALRPIGAGRGDDEEERRPLAATLDAATLQTLHAGLTAFFDHLTPPAQATPEHFARWVQGALLGLAPDGEAAVPSLELAAAALEGPHAARDERALAIVLRALRALVEAAALLPAPGETVPWSDFQAELTAMLASLRLAAEPTRAAVRFAALEEGRRSATEHLWLLGLSEGEFPRAPEPDLFYAPAERTARHAPPIALRQVEPAEEASLWWQVTSNSRQTLTLLRPRLDEKGTPWEPSPYWEALLDKVPAPVEELPISAAPEPVQAASPGELLLALTALGQAAPPLLHPAQTRVRRAWELMHRRHDHRQPPGPHEGILAELPILELLAARYSAGQQWSASSLNRYARCPYGFFAQKVLRLEPRPDPAEGFDLLQRGSLLHEVLEQLFKAMAQAKLRPCPDDEAAILALFDEHCSRLFQSAPARYGVRPGALWQQEQQELRRQLRALLLAECQGDEGFSPWLQEYPIRVTLAHPDGRTLEFQGVIDRLDRDEAGQLRLVDYKSGRTRYSQRDIEEGQALQSALYALAAEQRPDASGPIRQSFYRHLPTRATSGELHFDGPVAEHPTVLAAMERALHFAAQVQAGRFPAAPSSPHHWRACHSHCDFAALCRVSRSSIEKGNGAQAGAAAPSAE